MENEKRIIAFEGTPEQIKLLGELMNQSGKKLPNEIDIVDYQETHYEVVQAMTVELVKEKPCKVLDDIQSAQGHGGLYEFADEITKEFNHKNKDREWDGEFIDEIDEFLKNKLGTDG